MRVSHMVSCSLQRVIQQAAICPSVKWIHHCIKTHCNFKSALITTCSQERPYFAWIGSSLTNLCGKMCVSGCAIIFTAKKFALTNGAATILTGQRDKESGLWRAPLGILLQQNMRLNIVYTMYMNKNPSKTQLHTYMHVVSALCKALCSRLLKMVTLQHGHLLLWRMCVNTIQNMMQQPKATLIRPIRISGQHSLM
jgi:hypothetical protein